MDAQTVIIGLLSLVCGLLAYWGTRLEGRVDELKENQCRIVEEMHKNYVPREDCRERTGQILAGLERVDDKLDRVADRYAQGEVMESKHDNEVLQALARIEKKVDALAATVENGQEHAATNSVVSGGLSGAVVAVALVYAQLVLGVRA